jgi:endoglucanase
MKLNGVFVCSFLIIVTSITAPGKSSSSLSLKDFYSNYSQTHASVNSGPLNKQYIHYKKIKADSIAPDHSGMRNLTSVELAKEMVPGWNLGNSLEAINSSGNPGDETAWGNPVITQKLIDSIKAAGFKSVRIPVAWSKFTDASNFTIDTNWLERVEEVVNYVLNDSMYAIINEHWDNGWIQPNYAQQEYVNNRLSEMWRQIAIHFRDYDDRLLFAGTNEVHIEGNYGGPTKENSEVQNGFNQIFVNTIRSTGGRNFYRHLVVQGYNTNIDFTVNSFVIPDDKTENRLMVEVHYYDPYNFTLNQSSNKIQWGKNATDPSKTETWANEPWADAQFQKMKSNFIDKGYAVILGEYGVIARLNLGNTELNNEYEEYRRYYMEYITGSIIKHGLVPFYWDNGYTGNYGLGIFNRTTGSQAYPDIVKTIMDVVDTSNTSTGMMDTELIPSKFLLMQNYPNPFNPNTRISWQSSVGSWQTLKVYDFLGKEIATLVNEYIPEGKHEVEFNAAGLTSGCYFYQLRSGNYIDTKKLILIK